MASPISPNTGQPVSFQTNVNRSKTKRWVEAKTYNYDGDEWGGEEYEDEYDDEPAEEPPPRLNQHPQSPMHPQSPSANQPYPGHRYGDLPRRPPGQYAGRIATNPAYGPTRGQPYFEPSGPADERRAFSANQGTFDASYSPSQRPPFSPPDIYSSDLNNEPRLRRHRAASGTSSPQSGRQSSMEPEYFPRFSPMADNRPGPHPDPRPGPYPGPMPSPDRRSHSSGRPSRGDMYGSSSRESSTRLITSPFPAGSQGSREGSPAKPFPPRKSSLSQHMSPAEPYPPAHGLGEHEAKQEEQVEPPTEAKPLPFVRPADIYRRAAEEKEREMKAPEESSRPSMDENEAPQQVFKSPLDPVAERKSEYGTDHLIHDSAPTQHSAPVTGDASTAEDTVERHSAGEDLASSHEPSQHAGMASLPQATIQDEADAKESEGENKVRDGASQKENRQQTSDMRSLRHNPSAGFTSVVHQAFEESQDAVPPTPSSTTDHSTGRSNSASASDLSPIIARRSEETERRPISSSTVKAADAGTEESSDSDPLPPPIRPGFRRDSRTPSPGNSPARQRPPSVVTADVPEGELGVLSTDSTPTQPKRADGHTTAIPRSESPTKGTVRDLAGKFENRSPSSSPERGSTLAADSARPPNQRLESFRPSLPGAWSSYSTSVGATSPTRSATPLRSADHLPADRPASAGSNEDAIPTAGPPQPREERYEISNKAFQALAAAGTALSGAFATVPGTNQGDDSSDKSSAPQTPNRDVTPAREYPGGLSPVQEIRSSASSVPPTPPAKDGVHTQQSSQTGYFPSPLRPTRSGEPPAPVRPQVLPSLSTDISPQDTESDRLRKEIYLTLSPNTPTETSAARAEGGLKEPERQKLSTTGISPEEGQRNMSPSRDGRLVDEAARPASSSAHDGSISVPKATASDLPDEPRGREAGRPRIQQKFSWEESRENVGAESTMPDSPAVSSTPPQTFDDIISPASVDHADDPFDSNPAQPSPLRDDNPTTDSGQDRPTIVPIMKSDEDLRDQAPPPAGNDREAPQTGIRSEAGRRSLASPHPSADPAAEPSSTSPADGPAEDQADRSSSLPTGAAEVPFRDILSIDAPQERIKAYNSSRRQLASQESGLAHWLQTTGSQRAEHHDLLNHNGRLPGQDRDASYSHKSSPSRSKLPWIGTSFGGAHQPSHADAGDSGKTGAANSPGAVLGSQQMQEEGKKLLQSAGKLGGKAGGAAKGLLAKGRSKWRSSSGGGDKAVDSSRHTSQTSQSSDLVSKGERPPSGTETSAPRISAASTIIPRDSDTWSLSYASSDVNKTTAPATDEEDAGDTTSAQPNYAYLGPPSYRARDEAVDTTDAVNSPAGSSPQISAPSNTHPPDGRPSRSVSDVDPHDQTEKTARDGLPDVDSAEPDADGQPVCRRKSSKHLEISTMAGDGGPQAASQEDRGDSPNSASSGSHYSQPTPDQTAPASSLPMYPPAEDDTPGLEFLVANLRPRRSITSWGSEPAAQDTDGPPQSGPRPAEEHGAAKAIPAASGPGSGRSPPYEEATPRYSVVISSKEAEAAADKASPDECPEDQQSLPAYQSPTAETGPSHPFPPPAIVPVADLSAGRRREDVRPSSRPFSFVTSQLEDVLHRYTGSRDSEDELGSGSSLGKEIDPGWTQPSGGSPRSDPCNDLKIDQPADVRSSERGPLPSQQRDYRPPRPTDERQPSARPHQAKEQYRIPGPYGQQFKYPKSGKSSANSPDGEDCQPQQPPHSAPLTGFDWKTDHDTMSRPRRRSSDSPATPNPPDQAHPSPDVDLDLSGPCSPSISVSPSLSPAVQRVQSRTKSGSSLANYQQPEPGRNQSEEGGRGERRGTWFKTVGQAHAESAATKLAVAPDEVNRSQSALGIYQTSADLEARGYRPDGMKPRDKDGRLQKRLKQIPWPHDAAKAESKKKGGFLRLGGLFTKANKGQPVSSSSSSSSPSPLLQQRSSMQRPVSAQTPSGAFPGTPPVLAGSAYLYQQRHGHSNSFDREAEEDSFRGQARPASGYHAPAQPLPSHRRIDHGQAPKSREPESFIGGRRLSEQRAAEQAHLLQSIPTPSSQITAAPPSSYPPLPHSAPPTALHFDLTRSTDDPTAQQPKPRATSQRFPPGLRIDTSARRRKSARRSQPPPAIYTGDLSPVPKLPSVVQAASGHAGHNADQGPSTLPSTETGSVSTTHGNAANTTNTANTANQNINNDPDLNANTDATTITITPADPLHPPPRSPFYNSRPRHHQHLYGAKPSSRPPSSYIPTKSKSASHSHALDLHKRSRSPRDDTRGAILQPQRQRRPDSKLLPALGVEYAASSPALNRDRDVDLQREQEMLMDPHDPARVLGTFGVLEKAAARARSGYARKGRGRGRRRNGRTADDDDDDEEDGEVGDEEDGGAGAGAGAGDGDGDARQEKPWMINLPPFHNTAAAAAKNKKKESVDEEEIVMCSTAYPGQEWMPEMLGTSVEMR